MITLFKKNETNFEHNGLGSLDKSIINPEISWRDNGAFTLEFKYPFFAKHGKEIENSSIIRANDPESSNLFFVYKITPSMGYVHVLCYQISYKLAFNSIGDTNIVNKNGQNALTQMSSSTQYAHGFVFSSDILTTANSRVVRKNPIEFLLDSKLDNSFVNRWGGHIVRHNFNIAMNSAYGSNKGYTIRHRKDLTGYEAEFDESTVITRIRPVGYDGLLLPEIYVDSPLINAYVEPRIQQFEYSDVKVKTKDTDEEGFSTTELAYEELRRLAQLEFSKNKVDQPDFSAKVEFVNLKETQEYQDLRSLKQVLPGDIVKVVHSDDNFNIEAQMVEYKYNPLNNSYISITLGNYTKSFTSKVANTQNEISQIAQQAQSAMTAANVKNTVYSLTYKPQIVTSSVEGDLLYLKNGDKIEMWILEKVNGELQWVLQVSDATQEELKAQMAQAKTDIDEALDSANLAVDKANANVAEIQANTQLINDVNAIANNAKTLAQTAVTNAQTALTSANTANDNANKAISDAGKLSEDVLALDTIANQAKSDADTALINANKGITDAKTALNKATGVDTRVTTEITNVNNTLGAKANSTTVDALSDTVSSQGTAISQNATDIKLKADLTVVNAIKGTVDSQGTLISQNASDIKIKANKLEVDTLSGRVSANETAIDVTSQGVSTLVTKTDNTNTSLSQFKQDYEGFKGTVYSKTQTDTKISTVQSTVDNFKTTVSNIYSSKSETDNKVAAVQSNVDKIGNYTAYAWSSDGTDRFTTVYPNLNLFTGTSDKPSTKTGDNWNIAIIGVYKTPKVGQEYTVSVEVPEADHNVWMEVYSWNAAGGRLVKLTSKWINSGEKGYLTFTWTDPGDSGATQFAANLAWTNGTDTGSYSYCKAKLEFGNTATPYMKSASEVTADELPKFVGYSVRQSENPKDFSWQPYSGFNSYKIIEATTSIEQNANDILQKASKTDVNTLTGRVTSAEGTITTMAGQIALKANQADVNTTNGKVSSLESSFTVQSGQITALNTKTDGQTTQIGSLQSSYNGLVSTVADTYLTKTDATNTYPTKNSVASQINQSATTITSNVQTWTNNKLTSYSTTQQTTDSITNAVANKADKSQITQLSNQITSIVTDVSAIQVGGQNLLLGTATAKTSTITQTDDYAILDPYDFSVSKFSDFNFEVNDYITLSFDWETTSTTGNIRPEMNLTPFIFGTIISAKGTNGAAMRDKTITASEQRGRIEIVFKVSSDSKVSEATKFRLRFDGHQLNSTFTIKNAKFEKGNKATDWCMAPQEVANQSQITQLASDINLRVSKGDVTSQINIEAGRTLIDTKQLLLNADTVKFSGSAFIPDAMIQSITANKITAGTINAANVNVINLNARALTAGTISGTNLSMNLDTGAVQFKKGSLIGNNNLIRLDMDNSYLHSIDSNGSGFKIANGQVSFFDGFLGSDPKYLGSILVDAFSSNSSGIKVNGANGASIQGGGNTITVGYSLLGNNKIGISGNTGITGTLGVLGNFSVTGSKNAVHVTRDGTRATPAYEMAESYLGDLGRNYTRDDCEVWVGIDELFSDTVNTDIAYEVFLQAYDDARFWVSDFKSDKFLVMSDKPMSRFAWEIKAKRRGYENERLVLQEDFDNKMLLDAQAEGVF